MKILAIFTFILLLSISLSVSMDILKGFNYYQILSNLLNPFWVMDTGEYLMIAFLLLLTIGHQIVISIKNKTNK